VTAHPASPEGTSRTAASAVDIDLEMLENEARRHVGEMAYAYYAGGAEQERLLGNNVSAWEHWHLHPRVLVDVSEIDTATTVLGSPVKTPVMIAPTALHGLADRDGEVATAIAAGAAGAALVLSSLANRSLEDVAAAVPGAVRWMQIYVLRDRGATSELVARAAAAGYKALVLTVDAPVPGLRLRELRGGVHLPQDLRLPNLGSAGTARAREGGFMSVVGSEFDRTLTFSDIEWLAGLAGLPVVVKGVQRADDARRCADAGAAGVVVSNHGGRQLDDALATADVIGPAVEAVDGHIEIYVDGGIRRGADVVKALALGARGVLIGRPVIWALATGGADGVADLLRWFEIELRRVMALVGAPRIDDLERSLVGREAPGR